jgi:hypothetical protein
MDRERDTNGQGETGIQTNRERDRNRDGRDRDTDGED